MIKIILLDVDGVLVYPGGYRAALRATVNHFIDPHFEIDEETLTELERRVSPANGIWPRSCSPLIGPISCRANACRIFPRMFYPPQTRSTVSAKWMDRPAGSPRSSRLVVGQYPAEAAFRAGCFSSIPYDLRRNLLTDTRNVRKSHTMRCSSITLWEAKNYRDSMICLRSSKPSVLWSRTIDPSSTMNFAPDFFIRIIVWRRSHPFHVRPRVSSGSHFGYAPEAELALELVGLSDIPLIGYGRLEYLAKQREPRHGDPVEAFACPGTRGDSCSIQRRGVERRPGRCRLADDRPIGRGVFAAAGFV